MTGILLAHPSAFGSGELKRKENHVQDLTMVIYIQDMFHELSSIGYLVMAEYS